MVGGILMSALPTSQEVGCLPMSQQQQQDDDGSGTDDCGSSFRWAAATVSLALVGAVELCWLTLSKNEAAVMTPRLQLDDDDDEQEEGTVGGYGRLPAVEEGEGEGEGEDRHATTTEGLMGVWEWGTRRWQASSRRRGGR